MPKFTVRLDVEDSARYETVEADLVIFNEDSNTMVLGNQGDDIPVAIFRADRVVSVIRKD